MMNRKGNSDCHVSNDKFRERYDAMVWDSDKKDTGIVERVFVSREEVEKMVESSPLKYKTTPLLSCNDFFGEK